LARLVFCLSTGPQRHVAAAVGHDLLASENFSLNIQPKSLVTLALLTALLLAHAADADDHEGSHAYHKNTAALFVGFAGEGRRENGLALGAEYERRLNADFGIGLLAEHTFGDLDTWVVALPLAYHSGAWKFYLAPGVEERHAGTESLLRVGAEYGFEYGEWEISPQIDVDFVDGEEIYVIGVTFGHGF
jgi:hypothetical protein